MNDLIECSICLRFPSAQVGDRFVTTPCGHIFHKHCITQYQTNPSTNKTCPDCRARIGRANKLTVLCRILPIVNQKTFKIAVIGDSGVGKTCLSKQFCGAGYDENAKETIGVDYWVKHLQLGSETVRLNIWDTAGQDRFELLVPMYIRDSQGVLIVFDTTCGATLKNVNGWFEFANKHAPGAVKILVGTKTDLTECTYPGHAPCQMPSNEAKDAIAEFLDMGRMDTSAKENRNVEITFRTLVSKIMQDDRLVQEARRMNQRTGGLEPAAPPLEGGNSNAFSCC